MKSEHATSQLAREMSECFHRRVSRCRGDEVSIICFMHEGK